MIKRPSMYIVAACLLTSCAKSYSGVSETSAFQAEAAKADVVFIGKLERVPDFERSFADGAPGTRGSSNFGAHTDVRVEHIEKGKLPKSVTVYFAFDKEADFENILHPSLSSSYLFVGFYDGRSVRITQTGLPYLTPIKQ